MAADIWSDSTISLNGSLLYFIDEDWTQMDEVLLNCTGFTGEMDTGEAIPKQTVEDLDGVGLTFNDIIQRGVCDVVQKLKGISTFLHRSGHRLTNLKGIQKWLHL